MDHGCCRWLQTHFTAVSVGTQVIAEPIGMPTEIDLIIRLRIITRAEIDLRFIIPVKSILWRQTRNAVGPVAVIGRVAPPQNFEVINILRVDLRSDVASNGRIRNWNAVNQPTDLVSAANVQLIVRIVRPWREVKIIARLFESVPPGALSISCRFTLVVVVVVSVCAGAAETVMVCFARQSAVRGERREQSRKVRL